MIFTSITVAYLKCKLHRFYYRGNRHIALLTSLFSQQTIIWIKVIVTTDLFPSYGKPRPASVVFPKRSTARLLVFNFQLTKLHHNCLYFIRYTCLEVFVFFTGFFYKIKLTSISSQLEFVQQLGNLFDYYSKKNWYFCDFTIESRLSTDCSNNCDL